MINDMITINERGAIEGGGGQQECPKRETRMRMVGGQKKAKIQEECDMDYGYVCMDYVEGA